MRDFFALLITPVRYFRTAECGRARGGAQGVPAAHFHPAVGAAFSSARRRSRTWRAAPGGVRFPGGGPWRRGWPAGVRRVARLRVPSPGPRYGPSSGPAPRSASPFSFEVFDAPHVPGIPLRTKPHRTTPVIAPARHTSRIGAWSPYLHTLRGFLARPANRRIDMTVPLVLHWRVWRWGSTRYGRVAEAHPAVFRWVLGSSLAEVILVSAEDVRASTPRRWRRTRR